MKKLSTIFRATIMPIAALIVATSCGEDKPPITPTPTPSLEVSGFTEALNFSAGGGTLSFNITSNGEWTVTVPDADKGWLSVSKPGGSNDDAVSVTATANAALATRESSVTVKLGDITRQVPVKQAKTTAALSVSPTSVNFNADAANSPATINVTTNVSSWSASISSNDWASITFDATTITVTAQPNTTQNPKNATITITSADLENDVQIEISQAKLIVDIHTGLGYYTFTGTPQGYDPTAPSSWEGYMAAQGDIWNIVVRVMPTFEDGFGAWFDYIEDVPTYSIDNYTSISYFAPSPEVCYMCYCYKDGETLNIISNPINAAWDYTAGIIDFTATYSGQPVLIGLVDTDTKEVVGDLYANYKMTKTGELPSGVAPYSYQWSKSGGELKAGAKRTKVEMNFVTIDQSKFVYGE